MSLSNRAVAEKRPTFSLSCPALMRAKPPYLLKMPGPRLNIKTVFPGMGIPWDGRDTVLYS